MGSTTRYVVLGAGLAVWFGVFALAAVLVEHQPMLEASAGPETAQASSPQSAANFSSAPIDLPRMARTLAPQFRAARITGREQILVELGHRFPSLSSMQRIELAELIVAAPAAPQPKLTPARSK
jgi:hypothetical protein